MSKVLLVSFDDVGHRISAPGIRVAEIARELAAKGNDVVLSIPNEPEVEIAGVRQVRNKRWIPRKLIQSSDVVILAGAGHQVMPVPRVPRSIPFVVDLCSPLLLEVLAVQGKRTGWPPPVPSRDSIRRLARSFREADLLLCASVQQREFYLGCMAALGRIDDRLVRVDPTVTTFLALVPFGCPDTAPSRTGPGPRAMVAGLAKDDYVLLWSGSLSDWYDPETVVKATALAASRLPKLRVVFIGTARRNARLPETQNSSRIRQLSEQLGLLHRNVFFEDQWIPYEDRANWLLDVDAAIVASLPTLEAEFAVRIRSNDYIWTGTPVICTRGGALADLVERHGLGLTVDPGDAHGMCEAIVAMSDPESRAAMRGRLEAIRPQFTWQRALEPLVSFCANPQIAPDRRGGRWLQRERLALGSARWVDTWSLYRRRFTRPRQ